MAKDDKCQQEINELKEEMKLLKQSKKQQHDPKSVMYKKHNFEIKNKNTASVSHGHQQENVQVIAIINLIEQTMKTLSNYGEQLKKQLDFNLT